METLIRLRGKATMDRAARHAAHDRIRPKPEREDWETDWSWLVSPSSGTALAVPLSANRDRPRSVLQRDPDRG
jgi:hypothetical protein